MQKNSYKGAPPRPWVSVEFVAPDGETRLVDLVADTGNPFAVVVSAELMREFQHRQGPSVETNFGALDGGLLQVSVSEAGFADVLLAYASDAVADAVRGSNPDFGGLIGLPLLWRLQYGGDADQFWVG